MGGARGDAPCWRATASSLSPSASRPQYRDSIEKIGNIPVGYQTPAGTTAYVPLRELADISLDTGASCIYHEGTQRYIPIKFSVRGRDLGGTVAEAQARIAKNMQLPSGYRMVWAGEFEDLQAAQQRLAVFVPDEPASSWSCSTACSIRRATVCWRSPASPSRWRAVCLRCW